MDTKEYRILGNQRAGIEGIPSVLRRKYRVDSMPVRGLLRLKLWFRFKIAAIDFKRLVKWVRKDPVNRSIFDSLLNFLHSHLLDVLNRMILDIKFIRFVSIPLLFVG